VRIVEGEAQADASDAHDDADGGRRFCLARGTERARATAS
jgi:hypothetical protein